jgi:phage terminase large subunit-like protein
MSNQYHFVVIFDEDDGGWRIDVDTEEVAFPDGTIYNNKTREWEFAETRKGYSTPEEQLAEQLNKTLDDLNFQLKTGEK